MFGFGMKAEYGLPLPTSGQVSTKFGLMPLVVFTSSAPALKSPITASITPCACATDESFTWIFQSATTMSVKDPVLGGGGGGGSGGSVAPSVVNDQIGPVVDPAAFFAITCQ